MATRFFTLAGVAAVGSLAILHAHVVDDETRPAVPLGLDLYRPVPEDNPLTPSRIALGRRLFRERRLVARRIACLRGLSRSAPRVHLHAEGRVTGRRRSREPGRADTRQPRLGVAILLGRTSGHARRAGAAAHPEPSRDGPHGGRRARSRAPALLPIRDSSPPSAPRLRQSTSGARWPPTSGRSSQATPRMTVRSAAAAPCFQPQPVAVCGCSRAGPGV